MATSLFAFAVYAVTRFPTAFSNAKSPVDGVRLYLTELNKRLNPDEEKTLNILPHHEEVIVDVDSDESATPEPENLGVDVPDDDDTVAGDADQTLLDVIQDVVNTTTSTTPNMTINIAELFDVSNHNFIYISPCLTLILYRRNTTLGLLKLMRMMTKTLLEIRSRMDRRKSPR